MPVHSYADSRTVRWHSLKRRAMHAATRHSSDLKERKHALTGEITPVRIDDASAFLCRFANGSMALFEATRYARGHKALFRSEGTQARPYRGNHAGEDRRCQCIPMPIRERFDGTL